ncbi:MAG: gamma-glutamyltransferase family protein [Burkholderiales bacterium]|nr:gamma-glutamyltransferase family protein [Burkholderiales bacterium]
MSESIYTSAYPSFHRPTFARNVVSTSQPLAAQAGIRALLAGGNAIDAALATAIALTVLEPVSNGIGADAFALVWDGKALHALNASGRAPAAWAPERFGEKMPVRGWDTVTVPGAVSAWVALSERFGALPFPALFEAAIAYARDGFPVSEFVSRLWHLQCPELADQPGFAQAFMPGGRAPRAGEGFRLPEAARSLELIAATRGEAFYRGELAERMAAHSAACGGAMKRTDLAAHTADWVAPLAMPYRGYALHEIPPNGQGIVALAALGILASFDVASHPVDSADSVHLQIEALKLAFADAYRYVADAPAMEFAPERLLDPAYLRKRAALVDTRRAQSFGHGAPPRGGTVYLATADAAGRMVSMIQSNYMGFGSGVVVPGTGISLQNRGAGFVLDRAHPNCVAPGKRPFHTIIPAFITRDGAPVMALGLMGGTMQAQGHTQLMVRMADYGQSPQTAIDGPRFRIMQGMDVGFERGFPERTLAELARRGHGVVDLGNGYTDFGCAQIVRRMADGHMGCCDMRRDSISVGC